MIRYFITALAALALAALAVGASANVFNMGPGIKSLETVPVGDPDNPGELSGAGAAGGWGVDRVCGAVNYRYKMGKYEVTAAQYCDFLNHKAQADPYGLYDTGMWSDVNGCRIQRTSTSGSYTYSVALASANLPVNFISFWDACRFTNWLSNGQGNGDTESGAYSLNGYNGGDGREIQRNPGAGWFLPSEDEWYKAAYYKGGGTNAGYWDYPTRSNSVPSENIIDPDPGNNANLAIDNYFALTNVGEYENSESPYGTFDQGGNVWEWNEAVFMSGHPDMPAWRGWRGGSFNYGSGYANAATRYDRPAHSYYSASGFRVATIPEPASVLTLLAAFGMLLGFKSRRS